MNHYPMIHKSDWNVPGCDRGGVAVGADGAVAVLLVLGVQNVDRVGHGSRALSPENDGGTESE